MEFLRLSNGFKELSSYYFLARNLSISISIWLNFLVLTSSSGFLRELGPPGVPPGVAVYLGCCFFGMFIPTINISSC